MKARRLTATRALLEAFRGSRSPGAPSVGERLHALPRLLGATLNGRYPGMSRSRLGMLLLGVLYLVSPVDLMPEAVFLVFGLGDDALVAAWVAGNVLSETDAYLRWERERAHVVTGEVISEPAAR